MRQAEPSDGLYRYAIRQMPKDSNLHLPVLETGMLPLHQASEWRANHALRIPGLSNLPGQAGSSLLEHPGASYRRSGSRTRLNTAYETGEQPLLPSCNASRLSQRTGYSYRFYDTGTAWSACLAGQRRASGYGPAYVGDSRWKDGIRTHIPQIHNLMLCR